MAKKEIVNVKWLDNMAFEADISGHKMVLDSDVTVGGEGRGPRPKLLLLSALGGCTGMDVVSILNKMRVDFKGVNVIIEGDLTEEHPKTFYKIHVIYEIKGKDLPIDKLRKAVSLSEDKYCAVSAIYKKALEITSEIRVLE